MDYTDLTRVRRALGADEHADDQALAGYITTASRMFDLLCTNAPDSADYFTTKTVIGERLRGRIDKDGILHAYPHTARLVTLVAVSGRSTILEDWRTATTIDVDGQNGVLAWGGLSYPYYGSDEVQVTVSYTGGLGGTVDDLPADLVNAVTVLAIRLYREAKSGLADVIGVAELGILQYTKAIPTEVQLIISKYQRVTGW